MTSLKRDRHGLGIWVFAAMLTGCGGSQSALSPSALQHVGPQFYAPESAANYKVLFNFVIPHGTHPAAGLAELNGKLYGTTERGGAYGLGTVFSLTTSGQERVLHSFKDTYGAFPEAGLTVLNGVLYGTTAGGVNGHGIIFSITRAGKERVIYTFKGQPDGSTPYASLTALKGSLYGTTALGGSGSCYGGLGCGTVFSVTTSGKERVLHSFTSTPDGWLPKASLTALNGTLYGTTSEGGTHAFGTVFSITTSGKERVLHSFSADGQGIYPEAGLTVLNGIFYGTTYATAHATGGIIFSITTAGKERLVYAFNGLNGPGGSSPQSGLTALNGRLYGTTTIGGSGTCGCGTVFGVSTAGKENVLYSFKGDPDAADPVASLIALKGVLYGTTYIGGTHNVGTAFALTP